MYGYDYGYYPRPGYEEGFDQAYGYDEGFDERAYWEAVREWEAGQDIGGGGE
jgi:hypothetical protein